MPSTVAFWIVSALVVIATLGVLLRALLMRHPADEAPAADSASVAIFRDQKRQLDDDLANAVIDTGEHARMQDELAKRLGHEVDHPPPQATASPRVRWIVAATLIALLPVASGTLYFKLGRPAAIDAAQMAAAQRPLTQAEVLAMIQTLAQRMKSNPDDPKGWALLGRSYAALGRFDEAASAFAEATRRAPDDAPLFADYADVLSMVQGSLQGKPSDLTAKALAIDPHNQKALALAAASATERHAYDEALGHWRTLASTLPANSDAAREVASVIADVERQRSNAAATSSTSSSGASPAVPGARIAGSVALSRALAASVQPGDTVFIFARAVDGPRMPLAVLRTTVSELPHDFVLDDSMAMAPGVSVSTAKSIVVEARVSRSGSATPASGDLTGKSAPATPGSTNIHVVINSVIP